MSIRGSNGEFHATLLSMLAELKRDGKRMDLHLAVLQKRAEAMERRADQMERRADQMERRADQMERRAERMEKRMEAWDRRMEKVDDQLHRTAKILADVAHNLNSLDRRVGRIESRGE